MTDRLTRKIEQVMAERTPVELAIGWLRYEAIRKLSPRKFAELHKRNLRGELFDALVTELI